MPPVRCTQEGVLQLLEVSRLLVLRSGMGVRGPRMVRPDMGLTPLRLTFTETSMWVGLLLYLSSNKVRWVINNMDPPHLSFQAMVVLRICSTSIQTIV
jgi:hypothetical protein